MTDKVQLAKEGIEAFSAGDWERFKAPLRADAVYEELATQRKVQGPDQIVEASKGWKEAFPDATGTITKVTEGAVAVISRDSRFASVKIRIEERRAGHGDEIGERVGA